MTSRSQALGLGLQLGLFVLAACGGSGCSAHPGLGDAAGWMDTGQGGDAGFRDSAGRDRRADRAEGVDGVVAPGFLQVSGLRFVDGAGHAFLPRGLGIGEWLNIESYMLGLDVGSDSPGLGQTRLREALVKAMGSAGADAFFAAWQANIVTAADVALWASWGVNTVRVPLNYHALSSGRGVYLEAGFQQIDKLIGWCKARNMYVVLDLHAAPGGQNCEEMGDSPDGIAHLWRDPATYRQWTIDLWQTIASRYATETAVGGYDILDEPYDTESTGGFSAGIGVLRQMYLDITAAIRAVDPRHILFFEGANWSAIAASAGGANGFAGLGPAWDPQMAWAFHKYWDANTVKAIQGYLDLRTSTQRPVWNGETGEDDQAGWSGAMIALLEAHDIGWNMWTYKKVESEANFYSIPTPPAWSAMKTYLEGGSMPSQSQASSIMMALAANAATSKCTLQAAWLKEIFGK